MNWPIQTGRRKSQIDYDFLDEFLIPPCSNRQPWYKLGDFLVLRQRALDIAQYGAVSFGSTERIDEWRMDKPVRPLKLTKELKDQVRQAQFKQAKLGVLRRPDPEDELLGSINVGKVAVPKKDGTVRICNNFSRTNHAGVSLNSLLEKTETTIALNCLYDVCATVASNKWVGKCDAGKYFWNFNASLAWLRHMGEEIDGEGFFVDALAMGRADAVLHASTMTEAVQYIALRHFPDLFFARDAEANCELNGLPTQPRNPGIRYRGKLEVTEEDVNRIYTACKSANQRGKQFNSWLHGSPLRRLICHYIDDQMIGGKTREQVHQMVTILIRLWERLGVWVNHEKTEVAQDLCLQGLRADLVAKTLSIPEDKRDKYLADIDVLIQSCRTGTKMSGKDYAGTLGMIEFCATLFWDLRPLMRPLYDCLITALADAAEVDPAPLRDKGISQIRKEIRAKWKRAQVEVPQVLLPSFELIRARIKRNEPLSVFHVLKTAPGHCNIWFATDASFEGIGGINTRTGECWAIGFGDSFSLVRLGMTEKERSQRFPMALLEYLGYLIHLRFELMRFQPVSDEECDLPFGFAYQDNMNVKFSAQSLRGNGCLLKPAAVAARLLKKYRGKIHMRYVKSDLNIADPLSRGDPKDLRTRLARYFRRRDWEPKMISVCSRMAFFDLATEIGVTKCGSSVEFWGELSEGLKSDCIHLILV